MQETVTIRSGLTPFILLDSIFDIGPSHIRGSRTFADAPLAQGLESLAQTGAYHVRYLTDFAKHAFLLKVIRCTLPPVKRLTGEYALQGLLCGCSSSSFAYDVQLNRDGDTIMESRILIAAVSYGDEFRQELLANHYRKVFTCLQNDTRTDC